jgi:O-antigen ligase
VTAGALGASGRIATPPAEGAASWGRSESVAIRVFQWLLAIYTAIVLTKIHEIFGLHELQPAKVVGALLLVTACLALRGGAILAVLRSPPAACLGVIAVLAVMSVPGAVWPGYSFTFLTHVFWKTLVFFLIAATAWCDRPTLRRSIIALVLCMSVVALAFVTGAGQAIKGRFYVGMSLDPNESALQLLVGIPFALYLASSPGVWKFVGLGSALALVAGVVSTGSRGGFLGLVALGVWVLVQVRPKRRFVSLLVVAGGVAVVAMTASDATWERFSSMLRPTTDYNFTHREGRVQLWQRGLGYMAQHPLLGVGVQDFPMAEGVFSGKENEGYGIKYSAAHNPYIQIGAELGLVGLAAFVGMLWTATAGCRRIRRLARQAQARGEALAESEANLAMAALGALVAFIVGGFFLSVAYDPITVFVVAVCIAVRLGSPLGQPDRVAPRFSRRAP